MDTHETVVAVYPSHDAASHAIQQLEQAGFDMKTLSIIGRDYHTEEHVVGYYNVGDRMKAWGTSGAFWGAIWGVLAGSAFFWVPGVGPLLFAGPVASGIVGGLEGAVFGGGMSVLGAGLYSVGIPKDSSIHYEAALKAGKFILIAHGTQDDAAHARELLSGTDPEALHHHPLVSQV